jgi:hypothetical protein
MSPMTTASLRCATSALDLAAAVLLAQPDMDFADAELVQHIDAGRCRLGAAVRRDTPCSRDAARAVAAVEVGQPLDQVRRGEVAGSPRRGWFSTESPDPPAAAATTERVPLTLVTSRVRAAGLKLGAHAFILKPVDMDELLLTAERALEARQIARRRQGQPLEHPWEAVRPIAAVSELLAVFSAVFSIPSARRAPHHNDAQTGEDHGRCHPATS